MASGGKTKTRDGFQQIIGLLMQTRRGIRCVRHQRIRLPRYLIQGVKLASHLMNTLPLAQRGV